LRPLAAATPAAPTGWVSAMLGSLRGCAAARALLNLPADRLASQ
jgi:hypothetical protein